MARHRFHPLNPPSQRSWNRGRRPEFRGYDLKRDDACPSQGRRGTIFVGQAFLPATLARAEARQCAAMTKTIAATATLKIQRKVSIASWQLPNFLHFRFGAEHKSSVGHRSRKSGACLNESVKRNDFCVYPNLTALSRQVLDDFLGS